MVDDKPLMGFQSSAFGLISLGNSFMLQPSVGYYAKGNRIANLTFEDQLGNDIGKGTMSFRLDYVELAIPVHYRIADNDVKLFTGLGPYFSYAAGGKELWKNVSGTPGNEPKKRPITFGDNGVKRFDAGFIVSLSAEIRDHWMAAMSYEYGVINTNSQGVASHNLSAGLTIGYLFK